MTRNGLRSSTLRALVVGVGGQGLRRAQAIRLTPGWELAGVIDLDEARAWAVAKRLGCPAFPETSSAIERCAADVVVVASPPFTHDDHIETALAASRHVLCEKPLTLSATAAQRFALEARQRGLVLATGFNHRFYGPVREMLASVRSGKYGAIRRIEASIGYPPDETMLAGWLGDADRSGGGVLVDNGSHVIDLVRLFAGEIGPVALDEAHWHEDRPGIDTLVRFRCESNVGVPVGVECSWENPERGYLSMEIECQRATLRFSAFPWKSSIMRHGGSVRGNRYWGDRLRAKFLGRKAPGLEPSLMLELEAVGRAIRQLPADPAAMPFATARDGLRAAEVVESLQAQALQSTIPFGAEDLPPSLRSRCA